MSRLGIVPSSPLSDFVELFWFYDRYGSGHARERVLPTGTVELVVVLEDGAGGPVLCGAHSEYFAIGVASRPSLIGVHFKPGGAFPFLGVPAGELHSARVPLDALWGRDAGALGDRLQQARAPAAKFRVLEPALLARAGRVRARHPAVAFALREFAAGAAGRTVAEVTERLGLSARRFIEVFTREVGLTPKLFCRVRRFQHVMGAVSSRP